MKKRSLITLSLIIILSVFLSGCEETNMKDTASKKYPSPENNPKSKLFAQSESFAVKPDSFNISHKNSIFVKVKNKKNENIQFEPATGDDVVQISDNPNNPSTIDLQGNGTGIEIYKNDISGDCSPYISNPLLRIKPNKENILPIMFDTSETNCEKGDKFLLSLSIKLTVNDNSTFSKEIPVKISD